MERDPWDGTDEEQPDDEEGSEPRYIDDDAWKIQRDADLTADNDNPEKP